MSTPQSYTKALPGATGSHVELFSTPASVKAYFEKVRSLVKSGTEYPVNLDDVWPLCYAEKGVAVRALRKQFIENHDYCSFDQNVKRKKGGTTMIAYTLSVPCMEFFVARKVRSVFEVYREVFHRVADIIETNHTPCPDPSKAICKLEKRIVEIERIHRQYITPRITKLNALEDESEWRPKRDEVMMIISQYTNRYTHRLWPTVWQDFWTVLQNEYGLKLYYDHRQTGEHLLDMVFRKGYGRQAWEVAKTQFEGQ